MARARILLVDDKPTNLRILRAMLGTDGYDIVSTDSGQAALDLVGANPQFDLILLDVAMPDLNGIEVCRRLKDDPQTQHIPVILISALHTHDDSVQEGLDAGADGYLAKPVDDTALRAWVRAILRIRRLEREFEKRSGTDGKSDEEMLRKFAKLSHRVNDPLQAMCAAADLLAADMPEDSKNRELIDVIFAQVERVARLVTEASLEAKERLKRK
jgi:two-component system cell cycle response regulator